MPPKPPVLRTVATALGDVARAARDMPAAFAVAYLAYLASKFVDHIYIPDPAQITFDAGFIALSSVKTVALGLVIAPFAVLIHRRIILGEQGKLRTIAALRSRVVEFYIAYVALRFVTGLPVLAAGVAVNARDDLLNVSMLTVFWITALYVSFRMFLLFPAIAIDAPERSVSSAFRRSRGLVWRSFIAALLILSAMRALQEGAEFGAGLVSHRAAEAVGVVASALTQLVITAAGGGVPHSL
jgi:hypothetical protein